MSTEYAVVAFPRLDAADRIESMRARFDPQASLLPAHVTVVFPFAEVVSAPELLAHVARTAAATAAFDVTLGTVSVDADGHVMLDVGAGAEHFALLHSRLYSGILARHLSRGHTFRPHVTVGRAANPDDAALMVEAVGREFARPTPVRVTELAIFRLEDGGNGSIIGTTRIASDQTDLLRT